MLQDLNQLGEEAKRKSTEFNKKEFILSSNFKKRFKELLPDFDNIVFYNYTSVALTSNEKYVTFPNQWFVIASFYKEFILALREYKNKVIELNLKAKCGEFKNNPIDSETERIIDIHFSNNTEATYFKKFLSNYDWWFGSKQIDRNDFENSAILKTAGVLQESHSYINNLANLLTDNSELIEILNYDYLQLTSTIPVSIDSTNTIYYGSPGTGKSYKVNEKLKMIERENYERITFHPEYDHHSFVGGYKPISEGDSIKYKFVPQVFTNIYVQAWQDPENQYYLAIEEINRGNCAEIFGDIFQLLDRKSDYDITPSKELKTYLEEVLGKDHNGIRSGLKLPPNLALLATMNTSDQSLFPMDSAFKRRWDWEYIPIDDTKSTQNASSKYVVKIDENTSFNWLDFIIEVNVKIRNNVNLGMDKCIGNYFIKPDADEISLKEFINKAIFYLWNDVFKDEEDSIFARGVHYEDFFPIETKGKAEVKKILDELKITVSDSKSDVE